MFRSKKDVDKHVQEIFRKIKNENERSLRCYNVAKLYYSIGDNESARHYVCCYLSVRPDVAGARKLLAQALEGLKQKEKALEEYKRSLELESRQPDVVLKVCELLVETQSRLDPGVAMYWRERAEEVADHHPSVFRLKEYLIKMHGGSGDQSELEQLVKKEIEARPADVNLRVRLVRLYLDSKRVEVAYKHAMDLETRGAFRNSLEWYNCLGDVLKAYGVEFKRSLNWEFYLNQLCVLERQVALSLREHTPSTYLDVLLELDQAIYAAAQRKGESHSLIEECVRHMSGQLCLHLATALLRTGKQSRIGWKDCTPAATALLNFAWSAHVTDPTTWNAFSQDKDRDRRLLKLWERDGAFRCSQAGHILLGLPRDRKRLSQLCAQGWREKLYQRMFTTRAPQTASSYFINYEAFGELPNSSTIATNSLQIYDTLSQHQQPDSLHLLVWLGMQQLEHNGKKSHCMSYVPPFHLSSNFSCVVFEGLQLSTSNLNSNGVESLSKLDVDTFLYASVLCAAAAQDDLAHNGLVSEDRPPVLPVSLTDSLCTSAQARWWADAYRLYLNKTGSDLGDVRMSVQRGLEVIRVLGNHGMDVRLVVHLAKIFTEKASSLSLQMEAGTDIPALEARALLYWKCAISLLERMERNQAIRMPDSRLFSFVGKELTPSDVKLMLDEGRFFLACRLMKQEEYEKALEAFQQLKTPYASFYQGMIYKKLADAEVDAVSGEMITSEMRSKHAIMLLKSRSALHLTLDRLRAPHVDSNHPLNAELGQHLDEVESLLARVEPETLTMNRNACDGTSDDSVSSNRSYENLQNVSRYANASLHQSMMSMGGVANGRTPNRGLTSTPYKNKANLDATYVSDNHHHKRTEARPSPERLDAQLRRMTINNDTVMQTLMEQNRQVLDSNKSIIDALERNRQAFEDVQRQLSDLKLEVGRLKLSSAHSFVDKDASALKGLASEEEYDLTQLSSLPSFSAYQPPLYRTPGASALPLQPLPQQILPTPFFAPGQLPLPRNIDAHSLAYQHHLNAFYAQSALGLTFSEGQAPITPGLAGGLPSVVPGVAPGVAPSAVPAAATATTGPGYSKPSPLLGAAITVPTGVVSSASELAPLTSASQAPRSQALPANVVITSSDVVPTQAPAQPTLSVTIPPQHRHSSVLAAQGKAPTTSCSPSQPLKVTPHNFQIPMPSQPTIPTTESLEKCLSPLKPISTQGIMPDVPCPVYSAVSSTPKVEQKSARLSTGSAASGDASYVEDEDYNPCADFKPIVPLPEEIVVTTGEENETVLFDCRAKLFRFVDREWKERGIGQMKILKHNVTGKPRILMRREQVHKICANHLIAPDMDLAPQTGSDRAWSWVAQDFADGEVQVEKLCVRFKTVEEATRFRDSFEQAKELAKVAKTPSKEALAPVRQPPQPPQKSEASKVEFGGFSFITPPVVKPVESKTKTATPDKEKEVKDASQPKPSPFAGFSFTQSSGTTSLLGKPASSSMPSSVFGQPAAGKATSIVFGSTSPALTASNMTAPTASAFGSTAFGSPSTGSSTKENPSSGGNLMFGSGPSVDFAALASQTEVKVTSKKDPNFKGFDGAGSQVFGSKTAAAANKSTTEDDGGEAEEFEPTAVFNPVIPLPSLVDVLTGEEDEDALFEERSKLLRFDTETREWKERGVGKMKVLKNKATGKVRLLMRREQVHKVCCNHLITRDLQFKPMTTCDKAITWSAQDFSEGEVRMELFALRFKNVDLMLNFKDVVENVQKSLPDSTQSSPAAPVKDREKARKSLSEMFKPKEGSWECTGCFTRNDPEKTACPCCNTPKPGCEGKAPEKKPVGSQFSFGIKTEAKSTTEVKPASTGFTFGNIATKTEKQPSLAEMFKPKEGSWECKSCYTRNEFDKISCLACQSPKPGQDSNPDLKSANSLFKIENVETQKEKPQSLAELFKPKEGSWECKDCYTRNECDQLVCVACRSPKPGQEGVAAAKPAALFNFGVSNTPTATYTFGVPAATKQSPETKLFSFGSSSTSQQSETTSAFAFGSGAASSFGSNKSFVFAPTIPESTTKTTGFIFGNTPSAPVDSQSSFGSPHQFEFKLRSKSPPKSPVKSPGCPSGGEEAEDSDGAVEEDNGDHIHFQPVIPLPDKVPVHTGEEDESVLFSHRAKLYRFVEKEWKERGIGDIKILRHNGTQKVRLLMRREQVLKLCLNHFVQPDLEVLPKDDKTWTWAAQDFSGGEVASETFACRFKTADIAASFKAALDDAQAELVASPSPEKTQSKKLEAVTSTEGVAAKESTPAMKNFSFSLPSSSAKPGVVRSLFGGGDSAFSSTNEVEVVYEAEATPEEKEAARKLKLPLNFFLYKRAPPCKGCPGCDKDSDSDQGDQKPTVAPASASKPTPVFGGGASFFGTSSFSPAAAGSSSSSPSIFGGSSATKTATPAFGSSSSGVFFGSGAPMPSFGSLASNSQTGAVKPSPLFSSIGSPFTPKAPESAKPQEGSSGGSSLSFLPVNESLSFSSLAAASTSKPAFQTDASKSFSFAGAGSKVFGAPGKAQSPQKAGDGGESSGDEAGGENDTHDPHFEPIIALPDMVEVRTGEEDEERIFCQRAKLFRFDTATKEWKERGVGEMKILKHPGNGTYRLLLRREQVHKVVLNQRIDAELTLKPLSSSDRAWCWGGMNYSEESAGALEELAVKFKNSEQAQEFHNALQGCQKSLAAGPKEQTKLSHQGGAGEGNGVEPDDDEDDDEDDEYEDEEEYDEDFEVMFQKRVTVTTSAGASVDIEPRGQVNLHIVSRYGNSYCVEMEDMEGRLLSKVPILGDSEVQKVESTCIWKGIDDLDEEEGVDKTFSTCFSSEEDAEEFQDLYYRLATEVVEQTYQYVDDAEENED